MSVGNRIKRARTFRGMTQKELGIAVGLDEKSADIRIAQVLDQGEPVAYPVRKGEDTETLLAAIDDILEAARQDGTLAAISEKYFGVDLTKE